MSCSSATPLPSNITFIEPPPYIHPKLSAFFGVWKGKAYQSQDTTLVVEYIDNDYADVIFSVGFLNAAGLQPENSFYYTRCEALNEFSIGWATANGNKFIFEMQDEFKEIKGYFIDSKGGKISINLSRANVEELSNIKIQKFPYVEYTHPIKNPKDFGWDNNFCWKEAEKQTILLSPDIRRYTMLEKVRHCLHDLGWELRRNRTASDVKL